MSEFLYYMILIYLFQLHKIWVRNINCSLPKLMGYITSLQINQIEILIKNYPKDCSFWFNMFIHPPQIYSIQNAWVFIPIFFNCLCCQTTEPFIDILACPLFLIVRIRFSIRSLIFLRHFLLNFCLLPFRKIVLKWNTFFL